ncbi:MAG: hypothetical protein PVJ07_07460 [Anaerolineales bacterium]
MPGLNLTIYQAELEGGEYRPAIMPGDPEDSPFLIKLTGDQPHFARLWADEFNIPSQWIGAGAPKEMPEPLPAHSEAARFPTDNRPASSV